MVFHYMLRMHLSPYLYMFICLYLGMLFGCSRLSTPDLFKPFNILALALIPALDANARDRNNPTALHYAAYNRQVETVQALVSIPELDLNATDSNGYTALQLAIAENHTSVIQISIALPGTDLRVRMAET